MAETDKGSRERRTKLDSVADGASWFSGLTPQRQLAVVLFLLLVFVAAQIWIGQEQAKGRERENREALSALIREANARDELRAVNCATERERDRAFQREENAKFRAEVIAALRGKSP